MANLTKHKCQRNFTMTNVIQKLSLLKDFTQLKKYTVNVWRTRMSKEYLEALKCKYLSIDT